MSKLRNSSSSSSGGGSGGGKDPNPKDKAMTILAGLVLGLIGAWILFIIALPLLLRAMGVRIAS